MINKKRIETYRKQTRDLVKYLWAKGKYGHAIAVLEQAEHLELLLKLTQLQTGEQENYEIIW